MLACRLVRLTRDGEKSKQMNTEEIEETYSHTGRSWCAKPDVILPVVEVDSSVVWRVGRCLPRNLFLHSCALTVQLRERDSLTQAIGRREITPKMATSQVRTPLPTV